MVSPINSTWRETMYDSDYDFGDDCFSLDNIVSRIETQEEVLEDIIDTL